MSNKVYKFKDKVFLPPYSPYYDSYKGHKFKIDHPHKEAPDHFWLTCIDNPNIKLSGYVELSDLEEV